MRGEWLKLRRTLVWPAVFAAPLGAVALNAAGYLARGAGDWAAFVLNGEMIWALLVLPLLAALLAAQLAALEHGAGGWRVVLTLPVARGRVYLRKVAVALLLTLAAHAAFGPLLLLSGALLPFELGGRADPARIGLDALRMWVGSFGLTLVPFALALRFPGFLASAGVGALATVAGAFVVNGEAGRWWPWTLAALSVAPPPEAPGGLTPGGPLAYSAAVALAALLVGLADFARRDA